MTELHYSILPANTTVNMHTVYVDIVQITLVLPTVECCVVILPVVWLQELVAVTRR